MKWLILILNLMFINSCSSNHTESAEKTTWNKIRLAIHNNEGNNISETEYDNILGYISKGKARWIHLYPELKREPFTGITYFQEGLDISMAYGLSVNPAEVLKFVDESNINSVCGLPFIEPGEDQINAWYLKTTTAMTALHSDFPWKDRCLLTLNNAKK